MEQEPPYQELGYLRDELNRLLQLLSEHTSKTINTVLLIWGGMCIIWGNAKVDFINISSESVSLYFATAVILFISNLILYYTAIRYYSNIDSIIKMASYLAVFYHKRPSETVKVGKNFSWELATFEIRARKWEEKKPYKCNVEYAALTFVSIILMFVFFVLLIIGIVTEKEILRIACIVVSLIYAVCLGISICWLCKIPKYTFLIDDEGMNVRHLRTFIRYSLFTKHYDEKQLKEHLGVIWDLIEGDKVPITENDQK